MFSPWTPCNRETTMAKQWNLSAPPVTQLSEREIEADERRAAAEWQDRMRREREDAASADRARRTAERGALEADPAAMAALRLLAEGPHPTRALTEVLDDLRPPF
jgi:hypothetical protein